MPLPHVSSSSTLSCPAPRRRNPQEAAYNLGRAAHHLGLLHIAVPYYERVLESAPPPSAAAAGALCCAFVWAFRLGRVLWKGRLRPAARCAPATRPRAFTSAVPPPPALLAGPSFDLRRDAAFNLSLIYKSSGADALARQLLRQHLTV